jgi:hypothetical protein
VDIGYSAEPREISICLFQSLMSFIFLSIIIKKIKNIYIKKEKRKDFSLFSIFVHFMVVYTYEIPIKFPFTCR